MQQVKLDKIVGGGQALGTLADGRKLFAWGGLPGERVVVQPTKPKDIATAPKTNNLFILNLLYDNYETIIVKKQHVQFAIYFLKQIYLNDLFQ